MDRFPQKISALLRSTLEQFGLEKGVEAYRVVHSWGKIVGAPLCNHTRVTGIQGETLFVVTDDHRYLHHLTILKPEIIRKLASDGAGTFRDIVFRYSQKFPVPTAVQPTFTPPPPPLNPQEEAWCSDVAKGLNPELGAIVERVLRKDLQAKQVGNNGLETSGN